NGTAYTFTVRAVNSIGVSAPSQPSASLIPAGLPGAPTGVTAMAGVRSASVSWNPAFANGSAVVHYTVTASPAGATFVSEDMSAIVNGLDDGDSYTFTVVATNDVGASAPSAASAPVT